MSCTLCRPASTGIRACRRDLCPKRSVERATNKVISTAVRQQIICTLGAAFSVEAYVGADDAADIPWLHKEPRHPQPADAARRDWRSRIHLSLSVRPYSSRSISLHGTCPVNLGLPNFSICRVNGRAKQGTTGPCTLWYAFRKSTTPQIRKSGSSPASSH